MKIMIKKMTIFRVQFFLILVIFSTYNCLYAQYSDIGIELSNPLDGDTLYYNSDGANPLKIESHISNYGPDTIRSTDSLFVAFYIDGTFITDNYLIGPILPDSTKHNLSFNFSNFLGWPNVGSLSDFCVEVSTTGSINDTITVNNRSCNNVFISAPTDISISKAAEPIAVFPNPSNGKFIISSKSPTNNNIEIYNLLGEKVYSKQTIQNANTNTKPIVVELNVPTGNYVLAIINEKEIHTKLIRIEN